MLGRGAWGPIGRSETLRTLDTWKWMEQGFGLIMGLGVGLGFSRVARAPLSPPPEDEPDGPLHLLAPLFLLIAVMWENLRKDVLNWSKGGQIDEGLFGVAGAVVVPGRRPGDFRGRGPGRRRSAARDLADGPGLVLRPGQLLFLLVLWVPRVGRYCRRSPASGVAASCSCT